jgi:protein-disulfide isomerase
MCPRVRYLALLFLLVTACAPRPVSPAPAPIPPASSELSEEDVAVPIAKTDPVRGTRTAPVTIVVFSDFQCSFCAKLARTLDSVRATYGDAKVRLVFKNDPLPMHPDARLAAEIGRAVYELVGPDAFFRFHDRAFREQARMSPTTLRGWAAEQGISEAALEDGFHAQRWAAKIDADIALAKRLGVTGTPASFVNGISVSGAQPYARFAAIIEDELAKASTLEGSAETLYAKRVAENFRQASDEDDDEEDTSAVYRMSLADAPARGPANAAVTIVVFSDYECPYCKRFEGVLDRLRKTYDVRVVWRDLPGPAHLRAEPAAQLARGALEQRGMGGFWAVHDALFASATLNDEDFERIAAGAGLDVSKAMKAVRTHAFRKEIDRDYELSDDFDVAGTPHSFVNGRRVIGAWSYDRIARLVDAETKRAAGMTGDVYDTLTRGGIPRGTPIEKTIADAPGAPFRGTAKAKVTIQEVGDYQCPFCKRADATIEKLLEAYPGQLRIVWRDDPIPSHADAPLAAEAAREAFAQKGSAGFTRMQKLLFENQKALGRADLDRYAAIAGLDPVKFARALDTHVHRAAVEADGKRALDAGVTGTPAFFVGPYYVSGAASFAKLRRRVDLALARASK